MCGALSFLRNKKFSFILKMRLVQFRLKSSPASSLGALINNEVVDLTKNGLKNAIQFIEGGESNRKKADEAISSGQNRLPLSEVNLLAPVSKPDKVQFTLY